MFLFAIITMSCGAESLDLFNLKNSLTRRLILFLSTALPTFLVTVIPSLLMPISFLHATMVKCSEWLRTPC